jgi:predicted phosphodiesterase
MRFRYFSDLHLEFMRPSTVQTLLPLIIPNKKDVIMLCGDIGNPSNDTYWTFMNYMNNNFKRVFVITGNHEYYHHNRTIEETNSFLQDKFKTYHNIRFLNNQYEYYENYCIVGTTLWTNITNPKHSIRDVGSIPLFDSNKCNNLHLANVNFLDKSLNENKNCIVMTHHMPSGQLVHNKYKTKRMKNYHQWFHSDLDKLIELRNNNIACWLYGHTHTQSRHTIYNTTFLCNPIGYHGENPLYSTIFDVNYDTINK